jgi:hypothetical protein
MVQETRSRPSELVCIEDRLTAFLFDSSVVTFGTLIENALSERIQVGMPPNSEWQQKYTLNQLLDRAFHLPDPSRPLRGISKGSLPPLQGGINTVLALAQQPNSGIKRWVYQAPENGEKIET